MEKPIYPSNIMRITQGYQTGTHRSSYAIDEAGENSSIGKIRAPFTGIIKKIYEKDANEVWLESVDQVEYPDGTIDFLTVLFAHANDISNLYLGKKIMQGEEFYTEGTKGNATGNHCHIECGRGKFTGTGWYKNASGFWSINNGKKPEECFWLDENLKIINSNSYNFKRLPSDKHQIEETNKTPNIADLENNLSQEVIITSPSIDEEKIPLNEIDSNKLIYLYTCEDTDLYGIYLKKGEQVYIKKPEN